MTEKSAPSRGDQFERRAEGWVTKLGGSDDGFKRTQIPYEVPWLLAHIDDVDSALYCDHRVGPSSGSTLGAVTGLVVCVLPREIVRIGFADIMPDEKRLPDQLTAEIIPRTSIARIEVKNGDPVQSYCTRQPGLVTVHFRDGGTDLALPLTSKNCDLQDLLVQLRKPVRDTALSDPPSTLPT